jgi:hypothetical protein
LLCLFLRVREVKGLLPLGQLSPDHCALAVLPTLQRENAEACELYSFPECPCRTGDLLTYAPLVSWLLFSASFLPSLTVFLYQCFYYVPNTICTCFRVCFWMNLN